MLKSPHFSSMLPGTLLIFGNGFKSKILQSFLHCNLPGTLIAGSVSLVVIGVVVVVVTSALQVLLCWSPFVVQNMPVAGGPLYITNPKFPKDCTIQQLPTQTIHSKENPLKKKLPYISSV